jgi:hypothetical protein
MTFFPDAHPTPGPEIDIANVEYQEAVRLLTEQTDALLDQPDPRITDNGDIKSAYTVNIWEVPQGGRSVSERSPIYEHTRIVREDGSKYYVIDDNALADRYPDPTGGLVEGRKIRVEWEVGPDNSVISPLTYKSAGRTATIVNEVKLLDAENIGYRVRSINEFTRLFDPQTEEIRKTRKHGVEIVPKTKGRVARLLGRLAV